MLTALPYGTSRTVSLNGGSLRLRGRLTVLGLWVGLFGTEIAWRQPWPR